jgi:hypothetical protein
MHRSLLVLAGLAFAGLAFASTACTVDIEESEPTELVEEVTEADDSLVAIDAADQAELPQREEPMQPAVDEAVWQSEHAGAIDPLAAQTRW